MTSAVLLLRDFPVLLRNAPERPRFGFLFFFLHWPLRLWTRARGMR